MSSYVCLSAGSWGTRAFNKSEKRGKKIAVHVSEERPGEGENYVNGLAPSLLLPH